MTLQINKAVFFVFSELDKWSLTNLTKFLDPRDLAKMLMVSSQVGKKAQAQFLLLLKASERKNAVKNPAIFFKSNPYARKRYITFDNQGCRFISAMFQGELEYTLEYGIVKKLSSIEHVNKLKAHLEVQISENGAEVPSLTKFQKIALENFRTLEEIRGSSDAEANALSNRPEFKKEDFRDLSYNKILALAYSNVKREDVENISGVEELDYHQIILLVKRPEFKKEAVKGFCKLLCISLSARSDLSLIKAKKFSNSQHRLIAKRSSIKLAHIMNLSEGQTRILLSDPNVSLNDVLKYSNSEIKDRMSNFRFKSRSCVIL